MTQPTIAAFLFELWAASRESGPDIIWSCPFIHMPHNRRYSMSDAFSLTGNTLIGFGKGWQQEWQLIRNDDCFCVGITTCIWMCPQHQWYGDLLVVNSPNSELLCSHMGLIGHYSDFVLESWQGKVWWTCFGQLRSQVKFIQVMSGKFQGSSLCLNLLCDDSLWKMCGQPHFFSFCRAVRALL